jgi:hypothetical protein
MNETKLHEEAKEYVHKLKGFWIHLAVYVIVNASLTLLNLVSRPEKLWFYWVLIGWGAGLLAHALLVFGGGLGKNWEQRKIAEVMNRHGKGS